MSSGLTSTESLQKASIIINNLDASKFPLLLNRIAQSLQSSATNEKAFNNEEQEKLQASLSLNQQDLTSLLDSITKIFEHAAYHMIKPAVFQRQLVDTLKLNEEKAETFASIWTASAKGIVEQLRQHSVFSKRLGKIKWSLNIQAASDRQAKLATPRAIVQLGMKTDAADENVTMEFSHKELFEFYKQLETIQGQLDSLR